mmetsp:Transcript_25415/g.28224  ORF Transcript_25415/g.28224 Transcript_25415/m.28224 type:complete len:350 (+) Transcript_25415:36-1085(+)|eukprot:CAMPEP_0205826254 /NCGR_PEP_ID=MMETSP0206-20130828/28113_1 /ASSEMBLY_ACC=CAM_ASM_000279 /TAXON_ID=36767 /ORGANISM="Euplotes focardii, Strain TN1" /LENGTH=349 /DNA_ID=CAMNT_0053126037 /DNA_START=27 /DNA_END=1076 /DNA_ORIENTATION=+
MESKPRLLITGISGYVGSWTCLKALESGKYTVRGTVRDQNDEKKVGLLRDAFGEHFEDLELFSADLLDRDSIFEAVKDCDYIIHIASPFPPATPKDVEKELYQPAVNGTKYILEACVGSNVKKVVITSSTLTMMEYYKGDGETNDEVMVDEFQKMWNPYCISKIRAEKFGFAFMKELPEKDKTFEMCTVHPSSIVGPVLIGRAETATVKLMLDCMNGTAAGLPLMYVPHTDVRDVANAHLLALEKGRDGERYALFNRTCTFHDYAMCMSEEFSPKGYKVVTKKLSRFLVWIGSWFNQDADFIRKIWGIKIVFKSEKAIEELGMTYIDVKQSIIDTGNSFIEHGLAVKKK